MSKLAELRARANNTKEVQAQRAVRISNVIRDVVKDSSSELYKSSIIPKSTVEVNQFVERMTTAVCDVVSNPVNTFLDTLQARGLSATRIVKIVSRLNEVFMLTTSEDYEQQLRAVAAYLESNPHLYDEMGLLQGIDKKS